MRGTISKSEFRHASVVTDQGKQNTGTPTNERNARRLAAKLAGSMRPVSRAGAKMKAQTAPPTHDGMGGAALSARNVRRLLKKEKQT